MENFGESNHVDITACIFSRL